MKSRLQTATIVLAVVVVATLASPSLVSAQNSLEAPANVAAYHGSEPGEVLLQWDAVPGAAFYRVGWVAFDDYQAATAAGKDWLEAFAFVDVANVQQESHTITRLTPGELYAFIVATNDSRYGEPEWSEWARLTLNPAPDPAPEPVCPIQEVPPDCRQLGTCVPITGIGIYSGNGDSAQHFIHLSAGIYRFTASRSNTDGNFFIDMVELATGNDRSVGIYGRNEVGGQELLTIYRTGDSFRQQQGTFILDVDTDHDWRVTIERLAAH